LAGSAPPTVVTALPAPLTVTEIVRPSKFEAPQPFTVFCVRKQYAPVVLKLPDCPPVAIAVQLPPPEVLDEELELDELELLDDVLEDDELELPPEDEELEDELELLELLDEPPELPLIVPAEAVSVTRSSLEPSSRRRIRKVCVPADRLP
jgi:hypothetical protein